VDRRKRILVNQYEEATDSALRQVTSLWGARVCPKVRLADALAIEYSGLSDDEYSYALKAHFDFVVTRAKQKGTSEIVAFAVEFDGPKHDRHPDQILRDHSKNAICDKLGMPLLRIDGGYLNQVGRYTLLGWLAHWWFLWEWFCKAQAQGVIPEDEMFDYSGFFVRTPENRRVVRPYDPFEPYYTAVERLRIPRRGSINHPLLTGYEDADGYVVGCASVALPDGGRIVGKRRCRGFHFAPVATWDLAQELAVVDAAEQIKTYQGGKYYSANEIQHWNTLPVQWDSRYCRHRLRLVRTDTEGHWTVRLTYAGGATPFVNSDGSVEMVRPYLWSWDEMTRYGRHLKGLTG
jgi:Protein of unknown function (DUF2726)